ncbi:MAG: right-handed parallel beta-helix repeat-containing protein [candidate division Zixibacteria bacterium]|nr:right-handed parallel beta-helix repeat-containing protein [candidate division Zixibacteria bacterium]
MGRRELGCRIAGLWLLMSISVVTYDVAATTITVSRESDLQRVIDYAAPGDTLLLGAKSFEATPTSFIEPLCGNCTETQTEVRATCGFIIKDKQLIILGADRSETKLITRAGYGLYVENADGTEISNLTITGGLRDGDGNATDAAIVVRRSHVSIDRVDIRDNNHRSPDTTVIVGIGGIIGREGAELVIRDCVIDNVSWDGIALYRGATATVTDCTINKGRGAGIGVTWDATCIAFRNRVSGFWKGIGSFGTSTVVARNNVVHDNLGWGMIATGQSILEATNNVVHHNGNCGIAPWSTAARGRFINNIITKNGWRDQWVCPCVGVWNYGDWAKWTFQNNIVWGNEAGEYEAIWEQTGLNGNLSTDPMFVGENDFRLEEGSPGRHAGDSLIFNLDGSRSHIGVFGGPQAAGE